MKTIIEAGHYYHVKGPSTVTHTGWEIGRKLLASFEDAELVLFVDNYHKEQKYLAPGEMFYRPRDAAQAAVMLKQEANHVFYEATLAESAPKKLGELLKEGSVKQKKGIFSAGGIRLGHLIGDDINSLVPTCVFLDYMLMEEKAKLGENQITVLPEIYANQQAQLSVVLGILTVPKLLKLTGVFFEGYLNENQRGVQLWPPQS